MEISNTYVIQRKDILLTHWGRDKMAAIFQPAFFKCIFLNENVYIDMNFI